MDLPGRPQSYWIASTPETDFPPQPQDAQVDVAILGGGIVGITAAYLLRQAGLRVAVVEAHRIVTGVTGHTTGKLTSQHGILYRDLVSRLGRERAQLYGQANQAAIEKVASLVAERGIECDFRRLPSCTFAERPGDAEIVQEEAEVSRSLGLPASFGKEASLPYPTYGAVCFHNQALFHPRRFLLALADAIPGEGSYVWEETRALDVDEGVRPVVRTDRGRIRAEHCLVATHTPFLDRGLYFARQTPRRSYVLATRLRGEVPLELYISVKPGFHSIRPHPTADGWLVLLGGGQHVTGRGGDTTRYYADLAEYARAHFDLESIEYRWSTQDNYTLDGAPYVGRYSPISDNLYVATGFGGWGMSNGVAAAMMLSDLIQRRENDWLPAFYPARVAQLKGAEHLVEGGARFVQHYAVDRLRHVEQGTPADLAPGEGRVLELEGKKVALYKDEQGGLHALSPSCAHQGCLVRWNAAERTWDCPCHGSRFRPDGTFIHGPTVRDLKGRG
ncbi:MAG: FAD-dependent oxidoreductase [Anaerolineae bacterium]|nr:FAD-dependent oxidoreductase [Anaerolineae bacterium]